MIFGTVLPNDRKYRPDKERMVRRMKLPPHILKAPPEYLDENMIHAFRQLGFGCLPVWTSQGCALFVHVDSRTIRDCRYAVHSVKLELHEVDGCPLIRLDVTIYDRPDDPLRMDCFLNIKDEHQLPAIEALAEQEWLVFHWYDENLKYVRSSGIPWRPEQRQAARKIIEDARAIVNRTGGGDFNQAKEKFIQENLI
jgi:hypothetical protein